MKTAKEVAQFITSFGRSRENLFVNCDNIGLMNSLKSHPDKSNEFGLIYGYGDAFEYKGNGIVVFGSPDSGKTSLVEKFKMEDGCETLADDEIFLFDKDDGNGLRVYKDIGMDRAMMKVSAPEYFDAFVANLIENDGYPMRIMLHFNIEKDDTEGFIETCYKFVEWKFSLRQTYQQLIENPRFHGVEFLEYAKKTGYDNNPQQAYANDEHLHKVYMDIKQKLDEVLRVEN
jgi:hypothetical protein